MVEYSVSRNGGIDDVIPEDVYTTYPYQNIPSSAMPSGQATFEKAYVVTKKSTIDVDVDGNTVQRHLNPGVVVSATDAAKLGSSLADALSSGIVEEAYICTNTVQLSKTEFIFKNTRLKKSEFDAYVAGTDDTKLKAEIKANVVPAYYCTESGILWRQVLREGSQLPWTGSMEFIARVTTVNTSLSTMIP